MMTPMHTPDYAAADAYARTLSRQGRNYALALIAYYAAELNGRRGRDAEYARPASPIVAANVANMIRHLLVGDCDARGTRVERTPETCEDRRYECCEGDAPAPANCLVHGAAAQGAALDAELAGVPATSLTEADYAAGEKAALRWVR